MILLFLSVLLNASFAATSPAPSVDPEYGTVVARCRAATSSKTVWIFEQWHLSPNSETRHPPIPKLDQKENQMAIYRQLEKWASQGSLKTVYAEGCEGKIDDAFPLKFNGWTIQDLKAESRKPDYAEVMTQIPMKLKAKFGNQLDAICGDDLGQIKQGSLALSDARGILGYATRLSEYREEPSRAKPYLEDVIKIFKMPKDTSAAKAVPILKQELKKAILRFQESLRRRNTHFVQVISSAREPSAQALVIGGAHTQDLVEKLEEAGIGCTVVRPKGYANDAAQVISQLEEAVSRL